MSFKKKITIACICLLLLVFGVHTYVSASTFQIIPRSGWKADNTLLPNTTLNYNLVNSIKIEDFSTTDPTIGLSTQTYLQGLYYYLASNYSTDLPYNYIIGWDGAIYEGAAGGIGVSLRAGMPGALYIGYFDNGQGMTSQGQSSLIYLLTQLNKETGVGISGIGAAASNYANGTFSDASVPSTWQNSINAITNQLKGIIPNANASVSYSASIKSITTSLAKDGNTDVTIGFTNTSQTAIYGRVYAGSQTASSLYVPSVWISSERSNATVIGELDPGNTTSISIEIPVNLKAGTYSLNLYLDNNMVQGSEFSLKLPLANGAQVVLTPSATPTPAKTITITSTTTGYLNVHTQAGIGELVIGKVLPGKTFGVISQTTVAGQAWYEITYNGTSTGWIDAAYTH